MTDQAKTIAKAGNPIILCGIEFRLHFFAYLMVGLILATGWIQGIVLAVGDESTTFAKLDPFYAWLLVIEHYL